MKAKFEGLGWKVKLQQRRHQYFLSLVREVAIGNALKKGDEIYYYLVQCEKRRAILMFLDGDERPKEEILKLRGFSFLVKK